MCPFCLGTIGRVVAGAISTGGLAALTIKVSSKTNTQTEATQSTNEASKPDVNTYSR